MKKRVILRSTELVTRAWSLMVEALKEMLDGEPVLHEVIIRPYKTKRSLEQNAYYWKLVSDIADFMGEDGKTGREYVSMLMKQEFLEPTTKIKLPSGDIYVTYPSTSDMTVKQLAEFCEKIERWAVVNLGFERNERG